MSITDIFWIALFAFWIYNIIGSRATGINHRYSVPPPPDLLKKNYEKCICNDIEKQTPGGRCEYCWNKKNTGDVKFKLNSNVAIQPLFEKKEIEKGIDIKCICKDKTKCRLCDLYIKVPEFPEDRNKINI